MPSRLHFDLALLRSFAAVADSGNMTRASTVLNVTQGAVSQHIARLESVVGEPLLRRLPRGHQLTPVGERLLRRAHALLALNDEMWSEIAHGTVAGPVRLGAPSDLVDGYLAPALKSFDAAFPQVDLNLVCDSSSNLLEAIRDRHLDIAVLEQALGTESGETLALDRLVWVGARGGRACTRTPLPVSLIADTCLFRSPVMSALAAQKRASRAVFENGGLDASRGAVRMDLAVSAWLASTVPADLEILPPATGLPPLPNFAITLHVARHLRGAASDELTRHLRNALMRPNKPVSGAA